MKVGGRKEPKWESKLWSYVSKGNGVQCPLYSYCRIRQQGGWCLDDNKEYLDRVVDYKQFKIADYDFVECGGCEAPCKIIETVEMLAQRWLKKGEVHCPPVPAELVWLADEEHPIEIRQLLLKAYHGGIWYLRDRWVIQLKSDDAPATKRFSLFHEAFHILAHCKTTPVFSKKGAKEGSFNETLADVFAAHILMPGEWVKENWAEVKDLDEMAEIFDVPKSAMCVRLKYLGLF